MHHKELIRCAWRIVQKIKIKMNRRMIDILTDRQIDSQFQQKKNIVLMDNCIRKQSANLYFSYLQCGANS